LRRIALIDDAVALQHYMSVNGVESKLWLMDFLHDSAVMAAEHKKLRSCALVDHELAERNRNRRELIADERRQLYRLHGTGQRSFVV
jgi:hypothetical protein